MEKVKGSFDNVGKDGKTFRHSEASPTGVINYLVLYFSFDICLNVLDGFVSILSDILSDAFFGIHVDILAGIP